MSGWERREGCAKLRSGRRPRPSVRRPKLPAGVVTCGSSPGFAQQPTVNRWLPALTLLLLVASPRRALAQQEYAVEDFSPTYAGKIYIADTAAVFSPGWVAIFSKQTQQQVLKVESEELALERHGGKALANVKQLPYGEQSLVISEDFNFDGRQDLAIEDGQNSCYHGPSFQIFLATATGFESSAAFTELAQDNCGMFQVDAKARRLNTMTKSGCCWHGFSEYVVKNNAPFEVKRLEDDLMHFPLRVQTESAWNGTRMVVHVTKSVDFDDNDATVLCSFRLAAHGQRAVLFTTEDVLYCALSRQDNSLVRLFPDPMRNGPRQFTVRTAGAAHRLRFATGGAVYTVQQAADGRMSIRVQAGSKTRMLAGQSGSRTGSLRPLLFLKLENVRVAR